MKLVRQYLTCLLFNFFFFLILLLYNLVVLLSERFIVRMGEDLQLSPDR